ncbi:MAG: hypothetical protein RIT81_41490 [Deltaproteobacteria bacterium]
MAGGLVVASLLIAAAPVVAADAVDTEPPQPRSETTGIVLPVVATFLPVLIGGGLSYKFDGAANIAGFVAIGFGLGFGPSFGHFYAGEVERAGLRSLGRTAAGGLGAFLTFGGLYGILEGHADEPLVITIAVAGVGLVGVALYLLVTDLFDARAAVRRHNEALEVAIMPTLVRDRAGDAVPAAALALRF